MQRRENKMEYSIEFGERLIEAANSFVSENTSSEEAGRTVLYLSLLSCEIILKSLLENAGYTKKELIKKSHNLSGLAKEICNCELIGKTVGNSKPKPASELMSKPAKNSTVGAVLHAEESGASKYPNEIRYGELITHIHPIEMLSCAKETLNWAKQNISCIKRKNA